MSVRNMEQLKEYMAYTHQLLKIKPNSFKEAWPAHRTKLTDSLGIDFTFIGIPPTQGPTITPNRVLTTVNPTTLFADLIQDAINNPQPATAVQQNSNSQLQQLHQKGLRDEPNFICKEPLRSQLLTEGNSVVNMELGGKTLPAYINESIVQQVQKVSGTFDSKRISIPDLWCRLQEVHLAPNSQLPHFAKIQALFMCLEGEAYDAVSGYRSSSDRLSYLECWKTLFELFGNQESEISRNLEAIATASVQNTSWTETVKFLIGINSYYIRLQHLKYDKNRCIDRIWNAIMANISEKFKKYVWDKNPDFDGNILSYVNTDPVKTFESFRTWCIRKNATENSLPETGIHAMRVDLKRSAETAPEEEAIQIKHIKCTCTREESLTAITTQSNVQTEAMSVDKVIEKAVSVVQEYFINQMKKQESKQQEYNPTPNTQNQGGNPILYSQSQGGNPIQYQQNQGGNPPANN
jgi:hypothetical protein